MSSQSEDEMPAVRARYTVEEDQKILDYIIENKLYKRVKGKAIWEGMQIALRTHKIYGRTSLSMKERYCKHIIHHLKDYNINPILCPHLLEPFNVEGAVEETPKNVIKTLKRKFYSTEEDKEIIKYICRIKGNLSGNKLWQILEQKNVLEGRSWSSLRNRYISYISQNLDSLTDAETADLIKRRMKGDLSAVVTDVSSEEQEEAEKQLPLKKPKRQLMHLGFKGLFKSPLRHDNPHRLNARLATINCIQRTDQPQPPPSKSEKQSEDTASPTPSPSRRKGTALSKVASPAPSPSQKHTTALSKVSSEKRPAKPVASYSFGSASSIGAATVRATSTPIRSRARSLRFTGFTSEDGFSSPSRNQRRGGKDSPANAMVIRIADKAVEQLPKDGSAMVSDSSEELIGCDSDNSDAGTDDDFETIIDPLYVDFVDNALMPFVVVDGVRLKLNDLQFPIVDVF